jgi:hypothetical protein
MKIEPLSAEACKTAVALLLKNSGNKAKAANEAGVPVSTFKHQIKQAAKRGFMGFAPVLPGFAVSQVSTEHDAAGNIKATHVKQRQEAGEPFVVPEGHEIKGISSLVGPDGATIQQWIKTRLEPDNRLLVEALESTFQIWKSARPVLRAPKSIDKDTITVYNLADHHLGLLAWKPETGTNYDLKIAEMILKDTLHKLVAKTPASETGVLLNLGDFIHSDSNENRTRRSGNALDVEGRYAKVLSIGVKLLIYAVELLLTKHKTVLVRNIPGNHDTQTALTLSIALDAFFHANKRVTVDTSPSSFWMHEFGKVMLTSTHGDMIKPEQMPGVVAAYWPEAWGRTEFRYCYLGHLHNKIKGGGEQHGLVYEVFQSLTAKDNWHYQSGYSSGRSMVAITHHRERGEDTRTTQSVPKFVQEKF